MASQIRQAFPAWKIYIFGVDVTEDVLSCSFSHADGRAPDTAEIVLNNLDDKYIVTQVDLMAAYKDIPSTTSEEISRIQQEYTDVVAAQKALGLINTAFLPFGGIGSSAPSTSGIETEAQDLQTELNAAITQAVLDHDKTVKGRVIAKKIGIRQKFKQPTVKDFAQNTITTPEAVAALAGEACRYHFQVGDAIFHSNDSVRVFWRDPFAPTDWYYAFSGFVSDYIDNIGPNGETILTIRCEDVLRTLRYARITTNPGIFDIGTVLTEYDSAFRSFYQQLFAKLSLMEAVSLMLFGSTATGLDETLAQVGSAEGFSTSSGVISAASPSGNSRVSVNGTIPVTTDKSSTGAFNFKDSRIYILGTPIPGEQQDTQEEQTGIKHLPLTDLATYQALVDTKVYPEDLYLLSDTSSAATGPVDEVRQALRDKSFKDVNGNVEYNIEDVIDVIGTHPELFPVEGRLLALLPATFGVGISRKVMEREIISSFAMTTQFTNRLQQIYDIIQRLDFSFYATGKGDLLLEMPLFDFHPHDFGTNQVTLTESDLPRVVPIPLSKRGPFGQRYTVLRRSITSWERSFSDEHVRTMFRVPYTVIPNMPSLGTSDDLGLPPQVITLENLIPQFGVRMEMAQPWSYIATPEAAAAYGAFKLNQWNSDARTAKVGMIMRMGIGPNRPMQFLLGSPLDNRILRRAFIATVRNVHYSIQWGMGGNVEMTIGAHYMRGWDGLMTEDGQRRLYSPLGGFASHPLNYNLFFKPDVRQAEIPTSTKEITTPTTDTGPVSAQAQTRQAARALLANTIADRLRQQNINVRNISLTHGKLRLDPNNPGDAAISQIASDPNKDPHSGINARAFDLSGSDNEGIFLSLIEPGTDRPGSQDPRWLVSNEPSDPALRALGARIIYERGGSNGDHVHIQWPEKNEHQVLAWLNSEQVP